MKKLFTLTILSSLLALDSFSQTVPSWVPASNLMGYWGFNNNINDYSGNGNNGTNSTNLFFTTDRNGASNSATIFNGTTFFVVLNSTSLGFAGTRTIACWMKTSATTYQCLLTKYNDGTGGPGLSMVINSATGPNHAGLFGGIGSCNDVANGVGVNCNDNTWHHAVGIGVGDTLKIYVDGKFKTSVVAPCTQLNATITNYVIGNNTNGNLPYSGSMDDVGIWNRALTDCEIAKMFLETDVLLAHPQDASGVVGASAQFSVAGATGVTFQWQVNTGVGGFTDLSNAGQYNGVNTNTLTVSNLSISNIGYLYRCIVTFGGCVNISNSAELTSVTTGIKKLVTENGYTINPNPAQGTATLTVSENLMNKTYFIFNAAGQKVMEEKITDKNTNIDLTLFSEGIYTIQLAGLYTKQFVVKK